jgi:NAD(P)-dependent dehydrogenase (short-subunit alcohol dehydrogenase family)
MKTALVTGANRGLGLEASQQLARRGYRVWLTARQEDDAERAAAGLRAERLDVHPMWLDLASAESVAAAGERLEREGVRLDALVNNGAVALDGFDAEVVERTIEVNFFGQLRVTDRLQPLLAPSACVVMVSSGLGSLAQFPPALRKRFESAASRAEVIALMQSFLESVRKGTHDREGWPRSAYGVSKAGLNALTRALAEELRDIPALVNAVSPGWVRTRMGGRSAPRSIEDGADTIVWAATLPPDGPTGGYFSDRRRSAW